MMLSETRRAAPITLPTGLIIAAVMLLPLLVYWSTVESIVAIWERSGTHAHGFIILPISLWLIWQRRDTLRGMAPQPYWPALVLLAGCGFAWLLADLGEVQVVRQAAFAAMLPLSALALLGKRMAGAMAFPLAFIMFGVPFGDSFTDPLIAVTSDLTVNALRMTGIPVLREGNNFTIPSGSWSVVEACSGVRYLIASFTLGCLYAYLTYRTLWRRAIFIVLSILVPIVANGMRAYLIVMIGHLSSMRLAVGFDHLIYGWVFFGLVMFLLYWIGNWWRQDTHPGADQPASAAPAPASSPYLLAGAALAITACLTVWPAYAWYQHAHQAAQMPPRLPSLQTAAQPGTSFTAWKPTYAPASAELQQFYKQNGYPVGLSVLYYRNQTQDSKLVSSTNRLVSSEHKSDWTELSTALRQETVGARRLTLRESVINDARGKLLVWSWYWIGGDITTNNYVGKFLQVKQKLLTGSDDGAAVMLYSPYEENQEQARTALRDFLVGNMPALEATLAHNRKP
ncbi:MAG: exosortase A [Pseudomonadota bacterium]